MISIHPEMDLGEHIVTKSSYIIDYLNQNEGQSIVDTILQHLIKKNQIMDPNDFFDALCFLYSLNFIEYDQNIIRIKNVNT